MSGKKNLLWRAGSVMLIAAMLLASCGGGNTEPQSSAAPAETTTDSDGREMVGNVYKEGLPIVKDPITLTTVVSTSVYVTGNVSEMEMWKIMEEETNVHIEIQEQIPSTDYADKVNLMVQSGSIPDIFTNSIGEITSKYYNSGLFTPLDDLIAQWSPSYTEILSDSKIRANVMAVDGHIYATPFYEIAPWLDVTNELFVNTQWLNAVGMEMPTTLDEFYNVLVAFRDNDPNGNGLQDELPMVLRMKRGDNMLLPFFANFGLPIDQNYAMMDGETYVYGPQRDEFREGLEYFNKLYSEGLLDPESLTQGIAEMQAKGSGTDQLMGSFVAFWGDDYCTGEGTMAFDSVPPLKQEDGTQMWLANPNFPTTGGMSISSKCENKEAAMRWADYINQTPYHAYSVNYGPESLGVFTTQDGKVFLNSDKAPEGITFEEWTRKVTIRDMVPYCILPEGVLEARVVDPSPERKLGYNAKYEPYLVDVMTNAHTENFENEDEKQEATTIYTDLMTITENFVAESIMNGITDESWNNFQETLKTAKIDRYLELRQKSLDRYFELINE